MSSYPIVYLLLLALSADILISGIFSYILFPDHSSGLPFSSVSEEFIILLLVAPVLETWIFQSFIIKKSLQYFNNDKLVAIILSAVFFGLTHYYSIPYIIKATIAGIFYAMLYFILLNKKKQPVIYIIIVHSIYNLIGFTLNDL